MARSIAELTAAVRERGSQQLPVPGALPNAPPETALTLEKPTATPLAVRSPVD